MLELDSFKLLRKGEEKDKRVICVHKFKKTYIIRNIKKMVRKKEQNGYVCLQIIAQ